MKLLILFTHLLLALSHADTDKVITEPNKSRERRGSETKIFLKNKSSQNVNWFIIRDDDVKTRLSGLVGGGRRTNIAETYDNFYWRAESGTQDWSGTGCCEVSGCYEKVIIEPGQRKVFIRLDEQPTRAALNLRQKTALGSCPKRIFAPSAAPSNATEIPSMNPSAVTQTPSSDPSTATRKPSSVPSISTQKPSSAPSISTQKPSSAPPAATQTPSITPYSVSHTPSSIPTIAPSINPIIPTSTYPCEPICTEYNPWSPGSCQEWHDECDECRTCLHEAYEAYKALETRFNGKRTTKGCMFDVVALKDLTIHGFDLHSKSSRSMSAEVYTKEGSHEGHEEQESEWEELSTVDVKGGGKREPTFTPLEESSGIFVAAGETKAIYVSLSKKKMPYKRDGEVGDLHISNDDLEIYVGTALDRKFRSLKSPSEWNGNIYYSLGGQQS